MARFGIVRRESVLGPGDEAAKFSFHVDLVDCPVGRRIDDNSGDRPVWSDAGQAQRAGDVHVGRKFLRPVT